MEMDRNVLSRIKEILKANPRGMNVTEIVGAIKMNRQSVSKYLEMLVMSGHVDVRSFGPSKVYYLSQRLPISAMLSLSYQFIIILDRMLNIINVNDRFLEFTGTRREDLMYRNIANFAFPIEFEPSIMPNVKDALMGSESAIEAQYRKNRKESYFNIKFIPMVLDDGEKGITIIFDDITKKKQIENALRESEEKFRSIIEQSIDGIALIDERGTLVEYNEGLHNITGYGRDSVIGKRLWDVPFMSTIMQQNPFGSIEAFERGIKAFLNINERSAQRLVLDYEITRSDGKSIMTQTVAFKIRTNKGNMLCAIVRDITEKKLIETSIKESEEKFRSIVEQSLDGIILIDANGVIVEFNKALENIAGYGRQDVLGKHLWKAPFVSLVLGRYMLRSVEQFENELKAFTSTNKMLINTSLDNPGSVEQFEHAIKAFLNTDEQATHRYIYEQELTHRDGTKIIAQAVAFKIRTNKGNMLCAIVRDITGKKQAEEKLKSSEERYRILAEAAEDAIYLISPDLKLTYVNVSGARIMDKAPGELMGRPLGEIVPYDLYTHLKKALLQIIETGKSVTTDYTLELSGKSHRLEVKLTPIMENGAVSSVLGISRDLSERKK